MRKDFIGCRDCGWWGPIKSLVPHSVNPKITACPRCGSGIHTPRARPDLPLGIVAMRSTRP